MKCHMHRGRAPCWLVHGVWPLFEPRKPQDALLPTEPCHSGRSHQGWSSRQHKIKHLLCSQRTVCRSVGFHAQVQASCSKLDALLQGNTGRADGVRERQHRRTLYPSQRQPSGRNYLEHALAIHCPLCVRSTAMPCHAMPMPCHLQELGHRCQPCSYADIKMTGAGCWNAIRSQKGFYSTEDHSCDGQIACTPLGQKLGYASANTGKHMLHMTFCCWLAWQQLPKPHACMALCCLLCSSNCKSTIAKTQERKK